MKTNTKTHLKIQYPENRKIKGKLLTGDIAKIADKAGLSEFTVRDIFNGYRRLTDEVAEAFIELMNEREELQRKLTQIVDDK